MKSSDRRDIYNEFNKEPRETQYKVEVFLDTKDGLEPFDAFITDQPPEVPKEGDDMSFSWIEDEDGNEVMSPIDPHDIGSDKPFTEVTSCEFKVTKKSTTHSKRNQKTENGTRRILIVEKTVIIEMYNRA